MSPLRVREEFMAPVFESVHSLIRSAVVTTIPSRSSNDSTASQHKINGITDIPAPNCFPATSSTQLLISRKAFIACITLCVVLTSCSLLVTATLLYRELRRRRLNQAAQAWGRRSRFQNRISTLRREVDEWYTRRYGPGCLVNQWPENPEMGSESPVEMATAGPGYAHEHEHGHGFVGKVWEMDATATTHEVAAAPQRGRPVSSARTGNRRKSKVGSLFWDGGNGIWMPKR